MPCVVIIPEGLEEKIRVGKIPEAKLVRALEQYVSDHPSLAGVIDPELADDGKRRTQDEWIQFFNEQGKAMISAPDIYRAAKTGSDQLIRSLRKDFYEIDRSHRRGLVTSTRTVYKNLSSQDAKIIHNVGSMVVKPKEYAVVVPDFRREWEILRSEEGLAYLRALFDTSDRPEIIENTLIKLSGKLRDSFGIQSICECCDFVTPYSKWKRDVTETATIFGYGTQHHLGFKYYGDLQVLNHTPHNSPLSAGVSRGVIHPELNIENPKQLSGALGKVKRLLTGG